MGTVPADVLIKLAGKGEVRTGERENKTLCYYRNYLPMANLLLSYNRYTVMCTIVQADTSLKTPTFDYIETN